MTVHIVISDIFQKSYDKLDGSMKHRVLDFIMKVQHDPDNAGLDLKIPQGAKDKAVRTARVNDSFRAARAGRSSVPPSQGSRSAWRQARHFRVISHRALEGRESARLDRYQTNRSRTREVKPWHHVTARLRSSARPC